MFSDTSTPLNNPNSKPFLTANDGESNQADSIESRFETIVSIADCVPNDEPFVEKGRGHEPTDEFWAIANRSVVASYPPRLALNTYKYKRTFIADSQTKRQIERRVRTIGRSPEGEPVFSDRMIDLWLFCEKFEPHYASGWINESEWKNTLELLSEVLQRDRATDTAEKKQRAEESSKIQQALAARQNPQRALASGISGGIKDGMKDAIREVLSELGLNPRKGKAGA
jgi:hypothetical protein